MAKLTELQIEINANTSKASKALNDISVTANQVGKGLETLASRLDGLNAQKMTLLESSLRHVRDMVASIGGANIKITVSPITQQLNSIRKSISDFTDEKRSISIDGQLTSNFVEATNKAKKSMESIKDKKVVTDQNFNIVVGAVDDERFTKWKVKYDFYKDELLEESGKALVIKIAKVDDRALTTFKSVYTRYRNSLMDISKLQNPETGTFEKAEKVMQRLKSRGESGVTPIYIKAVVDRTQLDEFKSDYHQYRKDVGDKSLDLNVNIGEDDIQSKIDKYKYYVEITSITGNGTSLRSQVKSKIGAVEVDVSKIGLTTDSVGTDFVKKIQSLLDSHAFTLKLDADKTVNDVTLKNGHIASTFIKGLRTAISNYGAVPIKVVADTQSVTDFVQAINKAVKSGFDLHIDTLHGNVDDLIKKLGLVSTGMSKTLTNVSKTPDISQQVQNLNDLLSTLDKHDLDKLAQGTEALATAIKSLSSAGKGFAVPNTGNLETLITYIDRLDANRLGSLSNVLVRFGTEFSTFSQLIAGSTSTTKQFAWLKNLTENLDVGKIESLSQTLAPFATGITALFSAINSNATAGKGIDVTPYTTLITGIASATDGIGVLKDTFKTFATGLSEGLAKLSNIPTPKSDLRPYAEFINSIDGNRIGNVKNNIDKYGEKLASEIRKINDAVGESDIEKIKAFAKLLKSFTSVDLGKNVNGIETVANKIKLLNIELAQAKNIDPKISPIVALGNLKAGNVGRLGANFEKFGDGLKVFFEKLAGAPEITDRKINALERISQMDFSKIAGASEAVKAAKTIGSGDGGSNGGKNGFGGILNSIGDVFNTIEEVHKRLNALFADIAKILKTVLAPQIKAVQVLLRGIGTAAKASFQVIATGAKVPFQMISNGAKLAVQGIKELINHFALAGKSSVSFGEKAMKVMASFWMFRRIGWIFKTAFDKVKESVLSAMNFIESYHFFDMVTKDLGKKKYEAEVKETGTASEKIKNFADSVGKTFGDAFKEIAEVNKEVAKLGDTVESKVDLSDKAKDYTRVLSGIEKKTKDTTKNISKSEIDIGTVRSQRNARIKGKSSQQGVTKTINEFDEALKENQFLKSSKNAGKNVAEATKSIDEFGETLKENQFLKGLKSTANQASKSSKSVGGFTKTLEKGVNAMKDGITELGKTVKKDVDGIAKDLGRVVDSIEEVYKKSKYTNDFKSNMLSINEMMTGYSYDKEGNATATGAKSLGIDADMLLQYQAVYAQMASGMGLAADEAVTVSNALSMLAGDYSSLRNVTFESSFQKMQQALAGQARAVRSLGIDISQATLQQLLYEHGIDASVAKLNNAQKTELRMIAILEQSQLAYGDLAKTINTPANQLRMLEQNLKNLSRAFGNLFLPIMKTVLPYLNGVAIALTRIFQYLGALMGVNISDSVTSTKDVDPYENIEDSAEDAEGAVESLQRSVQGFDQLHILGNKSSLGLGDDFQDSLDALLNADYQKYLSEWKKAFDEMISKAQEIADKIYNAFMRLKELLNYDDWGEFGANLAEKINEWIEKLKELLDWENLRGIVEPWIKRFTSFFNGLVSNINWYALGEAIGNGLNSWFHIIRDFFDGINWTMLGQKLAEGLNGLIHTIDWANMGAAFASQLNAWIRGAFGFLSTFNWKEFGDSIGRMLNSMIRNIDWETLKSDLVLFVNGVIDAGIAFVRRFDFKGLAEKLTGLINYFIDNVNWDNLGTLFGEGVNKIFDAIYVFATETKWTELGKNIGKAMKKFIDEIDFGDIGATFRALFFGVFSAINGWFEEFDGVDENGEKGLKKIGSKIADFVNNLVDEETMNSAGEAFSNAFNGIFEIAAGFVENFNWIDFTNALTSGIRTAIRGIDTEMVGRTIKDVVRTLLLMFKQFVSSGALREFGQKVGKVLKFTSKDWLNWFTVASENIKEALRQLFSGLSAGLFEEGSFGKGLFDGLTDGAIGVLTVIQNLTTAIAKLASALLSLGGKGYKFDVEGNVVDADGNPIETDDKKTLSESIGGLVGKGVVGTATFLTGKNILSKLFGGGKTAKAVKAATTATEGGGLISGLKNTFSGAGKFIGDAGAKIGEIGGKVASGLPKLGSTVAGIATNPMTYMTGGAAVLTGAEIAKAKSQYDRLDQNAAIQPIRSYMNMRADVPENVKNDLEWKFAQATKETDYDTSADMIAAALKSSGLSYDSVASWAQKTGLDLKGDSQFADIMARWNGYNIFGDDSDVKTSDGVKKVGEVFTQFHDTTAGQIDDLKGNFGEFFDGLLSGAVKTSGGVQSQMDKSAVKGKQTISVGKEVTATYNGTAQAVDNVATNTELANRQVSQGKQTVQEYGNTALESFKNLNLTVDTSAEKFAELGIEASKPLPDNYSQYLTPLLTQLGVSKEGVKNLNTEIANGEGSITTVGDLYDALMTKFGGTEENVAKINGVFSTYFGASMPGEVDKTSTAVNGLNASIGETPNSFAEMEGGSANALGNMGTGMMNYDEMVKSVFSRMSDPSSFNSLGFNGEQANNYLRTEFGLSDIQIQKFWERVGSDDSLKDFVSNVQNATKEVNNQYGLSDATVKAFFGTTSDPTGFNNFENFSTHANEILRNEFGYSDEMLQEFWGGFEDGTTITEEGFKALTDALGLDIETINGHIGSFGTEVETKLPQSVKAGVEETKGYISDLASSIEGELGGLADDELGIEIWDSTGTMSWFEKAKISDVKGYKPLDKVKAQLAGVASSASQTVDAVNDSMDTAAKNVSDKAPEFKAGAAEDAEGFVEGFNSKAGNIANAPVGPVTDAIAKGKEAAREAGTVADEYAKYIVDHFNKDATILPAVEKLMKTSVIDAAQKIIGPNGPNGGAPGVGKSYVDGVSGSIDSNASTAKTAAEGVGDAILEPLTSEEFKTDTKGAGNGIVSNVADGINTSDEAMTATENLKKGIVGKFDNVSTDIAGQFANIGTEIEKTVSNADMTSAVNAIASKFSGLPVSVATQMTYITTEVSNALEIAGKNFAVTLGNAMRAEMANLKLPMPHYELNNLQPYSQVSNGNGGTINIPNFVLNWYASGGFPKSGEMFIANEAGPEMIGKFGNQTAVANNLQIIEGIASGVASSMRDFVPYVTQGTKDALTGMKEFISSMVPAVSEASSQSTVSIAGDLQELLVQMVQATRDSSYIAADRIEWGIRSALDEYKTYDTEKSVTVANGIADRIIDGLYNVTRESSEYILENLVDTRSGSNTDGKPYVMTVNVLLDRDVVARQVQEGILGQQDRMINSYS